MKPFFYRIDAGALIDFATDAEGESITLLQFAKDLQKGKSDIAFIQSIIDEASNYIESKREAGRRGGLAKASNALAKASSAIAEPSSALANSSTPLAKASTPLASSSNSNRNIKTKPIEETYSQSFLSFWSEYPKKTGKDDAWKAWQKAKPELQDVLSALQWQKRSEQWVKDGGQYIPNPSTYINQGRWKDEPPLSLTRPSFMPMNDQPYC